MSLKHVIFSLTRSSVLMWIEQVDRTKGYDIIFISSDTESKERLSVPQLANCRILSQYLNVPDGALYLLASCTYTTILYSFNLAVRHLSPICYLRTTLGIAIFRDVLYTYSPLQLFSSRLEGASPEHDIYLKEIGHQRQSGDRYRHITVVDQSLQPEGTSYHTDFTMYKKIRIFCTYRVDHQMHVMCCIMVCW